MRTVTNLVRDLAVALNALWKHAIDWPNGDPADSPRHGPGQLTPFDVSACITGGPGADGVGPPLVEPSPIVTPTEAISE